MIKAERQKKILALMDEASTVSVTELAKSFGISPITIRRDLIELDEKGLLERTHGGAMATQVVLADGSARYGMYNYQDRNNQQAEDKTAIAECAAQFISDGDNILINAGTTTQALALALRAHQDLYVVTNGLSVASTVGSTVRAHVYVLAGRLDTRTQATMQSPLSEELREIQVREAFLGVHAMSAKGIYTRSKEDAGMTRALIAAASKVTVLADHTKFDSFASFRVCDLSRIARVITDAKTRPDTIRMLEAQGIDVVVAS